MDNILTSLNAGSGIDVKALTEGLVAAERAPRLALLEARETRAAARISALGQFRAALDALVGALDSRVASGALSGIPAVSDPSVLSVRVDPGATLARQTLEVRQLARGQTLASAPVADAAAPVGQGTLTFRFGSVAGTGEATGFTAGSLPDLVVTVGPGDDSLAGLKDAINDAAAVAGAPLQAQLVTDAQGTRLLLRGGLGDDSGFTATADGAPGLGAFAFAQGVTGGLSRTQAAADALVAVDGLELRRPANAIADLLPGARLALLKAAPGTLVSLEAARDPAELSQAVRDIAGALNELSALGRELSAAEPATGSAGALVADSATRRVLQGLGALPSRVLLPGASGGPVRLNEIGLTLDRNGNFQVDEARLSRAVAESPAAVEALVTAMNARGGFGVPAGPLRQLSDGFRQAAQGSAGQPTALQREQQAIARERAALDQKTERSRETYARQFAALDRAVGQSRALQAFLTQQVDLWTRSLGR
jgi:flagellar hook-associated protein 2